MYLDLAHALLARGLLLISADRKRKLAVLAATVLAAVVSAWQGWPLILAISIALALSLFAPDLSDRIHALWLIRKITRAHHAGGVGLDAEKTLLEMGIDSAAIADVLKGIDSGGEVVIAEFDQNNRVVSQVGKIPLLEDALITADAFVKRSRNRLQIVGLAEGIAVKKQYSVRGRFLNEVLALDALRHVEGIPRILRVSAKQRTLHISFAAGRNLGGLMIDRGADVSAQYRAGLAYPGYGNWSTSEAPQGYRSLVLKALHDTVDDAFISALERLVVRIHAAGVALRDIKHGNIIIYGGQPHIVDFDLSHRHFRNSTRFILRREEERDRFNFLFGTRLLTERSLHEQLAADLGDNGHAGCPPFYFGKGYRLGRTAAAAQKSRRLYMLRRRLPEFRGHTIVHLGGDDGLLPVELLRSGAAKVLAYDSNPLVLQSAELICRFAEFIDNRPYELELHHEPPSAIGPEQLRDCSLAIASDALDSYPDDEVRRICSGLVHQVDVLALERRRPPKEAAEPDLGRRSTDELRALLGESGFAETRGVRLGRRAGTLILARSRGD